MGDFSVKGVLRRHVGVTGDYSLKSVLFPVPVPVMSVRSALEVVAWTEHEYQRHEPDDPFAIRWTARYVQTWTRIHVRIELKPNNKDSEDALDNGLRDAWEIGIEDAWSDRYWARASGELACRLSFEVVWVDKDAHHTVHVKFVDPGDPPPRSDLTHWDTEDPGSTAAHEYGHMIGKYDEYQDPDVPGREQVETGTIMDNNSSTFSPRQFTRFAQDLGCFVCDENGTLIPKPY
jgi:hypothetical protein